MLIFTDKTTRMISEEKSDLIKKSEIFSPGSVNNRPGFSKIIIYTIMVFSFFSCTKQTPVLYEVNLEREFDIPAGLNNIETHYLYLRNVPTFFRQFASANGVDSASVSSVRAARGLLESQFQSTNFDFIDRISISVVSRKDPDLRREMYYLDEVPFNTGSEMRMLSSTTELRNVIEEEFVDIEIRLNLRASMGTSIRTKLIFSYAVF